MESSQQQTHSLTTSLITRSITFDQLWIIGTIAAIWIFISILPLPPNDLWWHMEAGRIMIEEGQLITTNRWAYTLPYETPYVYQSWLSEIILYLTWRAGDVPLLMLLRTFVITGSYALIAWHAWRRVGPSKTIALAVFLAILMGWNNWTLRPQTLALLPGSAFAVILGEYILNRVSSRWLIGLPIIMMLWVNLHGSFVLGIALLGLAWLGVAITLLRTKQITDQSARRRFLKLTYVLIVTMIAATIHPLGFGIFSYVQDMLTNTALQTRFVEWQPPQNDIDILSTGFWFFAVLLLLAALMVVSGKRPTDSDMLWYLGLAWLGIGGKRYAVWFGLLLIPLLAEQAAALFHKRTSLKCTPIFTWTIFILFGSAMIAVLPWFSPGQHFQSDRLFATTGPHRWLLTSTTPVAATNWLKDHPIEGRFWTDLSYSSYTIWELPEKQVFADLRVELFPETIWDDHFDIVRGNQHSLELLDTWEISHLLLRQRTQAELWKTLEQSPEWCEQYRDRDTVIMARCSHNVKTNAQP
ncbi:MAG: hypothetical protein AAGF95_22840 [Chloroflexota bacterium]